MSNTAVVVAQKISSALSVLGSTFIAQEILRHPAKRGKVVFRLLAAMSVSDAFCSCWFFIGTWAVPRGSEGIPGAKGNGTTCKLQAFILYGAVTTFNFNACLGLYYLLSIRYSWREETIRKNVEPFCYVYAIGIGLVVGITPIILDVFNPANFWCSIRPDPDQGLKRIWFLFYIPCWFAMLFVTYAMIVIYWHVRKTETRVQRYDFRNSTSRTSSTLRASASRTSTVSSSITATMENHTPRQQRKRSAKVATQAISYCLVFFLTLTIPTTTRTVQTLGGNVPDYVLVLFMWLYPLQGFLNFLVYMRPRWQEALQKWLKRHRPHSSRISSHTRLRYNNTTINSNEGDQMSGALSVGDANGDNASGAFGDASVGGFRMVKALSLIQEEQSQRILQEEQSQRALMQQQQEQEQPLEITAEEPIADSAIVEIEQGTSIEPISESHQEQPNDSAEPIIETEDLGSRDLEEAAGTLTVASTTTSQEQQQHEQRTDEDKEQSKNSAEPIPEIQQEPPESAESIPEIQPKPPNSAEPVSDPEIAIDV